MSRVSPRLLTSSCVSVIDRRLRPLLPFCHSGYRLPDRLVSFSRVLLVSSLYIGASCRIVIQLVMDLWPKCVEYLIRLFSVWIPCVFPFLNSVLDFLQILFWKRKTRFFLFLQPGLQFCQFRKPNICEIITLGTIWLNSWIRRLFKNSKFSFIWCHNLFLPKSSRRGSSGRHSLSQPWAPCNRTPLGDGKVRPHRPSETSSSDWIIDHKWGQTV